MSVKLQDLNRRDIPLFRRKIKETVPEFFRSEYPTFITFLEKYYQFLDSDGQHSFDTTIQKLFSTRDVDQTPENLLDLFGRELGAGLLSTSIFEDERYSIKRFGDLYRNKGTLVGAEQFFRHFYQIEPEITFPKEQLFKVGTSEIGPDQEKVLQNNERFQELSILFKTSLSSQTWKDLYKKYAHPAGFFFAGDVRLTQSASFLSNTPEVILVTDSFAVTVIDTATVSSITPFTQFTTLLSDPGTGLIFRHNPEEKISKYESLTIQQIDKIYRNYNTFATPSSFKFNNGHRLAFDLQDSTMTAQVDQDAHSIGTIKMWNDDSAFPNYEQPRGGNMLGVDSTGYIDSGETIAVFSGNKIGGSRSRIFLQNRTMNLSNVKHLTYWVNAGIGGAAGWGGTPNPADDLLFQFARASASSDFITLDTVDVDGVVIGRWTKRDINIEGVADSNVLIRFQQIGGQSTVDRDNWAITSVYVDSSYDSAAARFDLSFETMDQEMFDSYGKVI